MELWRFINSFAPWLAALGSIAASVVALYLARRDSRPRLEVSAFISGGIKHSSSGVPDYTQAQFVISITNVWRRPTTVICIYWQTGLLRRKRHMLPLPHGKLTESLPASLVDGITIYLAEPLDRFLLDISPAFQDVPRGRVLRELRLRRMRIVIQTSIGRHFYCSMPAHLMSIMKDECPKHKWTDLSAK